MSEHQFFACMLVLQTVSGVLGVAYLARILHKVEAERTSNR